MTLVLTNINEILPISVPISAHANSLLMVAPGLLMVCPWFANGLPVTYPLHACLSMVYGLSSVGKLL